jgi:hypothetical protein
MGTHVKESHRIGVQRIGVLNGREHSQGGFAIHDILTGTWHCGTTKVSGLQEALYRSSGKGKTEFINVRTRDPREFRKPDRRIKGGEVKSTRVSENRHHRDSEFEFRFVDIASSDFPITEKFR